MKKLSTLYVVDFMNVVHLYWYALSYAGYLNPDNLSKIAALSWLNGIHTYNGVGLTEDDRVLIALDSRHTFRHDLADNYKAGRQESNINFGEVEEMAELFKMYNINVLGIPYLEADDVLTSAVLQYQNDFEEIVIIGKDKDYYGLINDKVSLVPISKKEPIVQVGNWEEIVEKKMKAYVPYPLIEYALCTIGDKVDNVPGIKRFGPARFNNLMSELLETYKPSELVGKQHHILKDYLTESEYQQMKDSLALVKLKVVKLEEDFSMPVELSRFKQMIESMGKDYSALAKKVVV